MKEALCHLCKSNNINFQYKVDSYRIVRCRECSLVFVDPLPGMSAIAKLYKQFEHKSGIQRGEVIAQQQIESLKYIEKLISRKGELLDVGCGGGFFLKSAVLRGWKAMGADTSLYLSRYARDCFGLQVVVGFFEDIKFKKRFDLVTMFQLIEHVHNPRSVVRKAHDVLKAEGYLVIETPNIESLEAKVFKQDYNMMAPPMHLFYFSLRTLTDLVESEGFKIVRVRTRQDNDLLKAVLTYLLFSRGRWREQLTAGSDMVPVEKDSAKLFSWAKKIVRLVFDAVDVLFGRLVDNFKMGSIIELVAKRI